jgi:hypothetical protein
VNPPQTNVKHKAFENRPALHLTAATCTPVVTGVPYPRIDWERDIVPRVSKHTAQTLFWYQRLAVAFAVSRNGSLLLALEAGMGKSRVAMALLEYYMDTAFPVLIVVPASMTVEWANKICAALPRPGAVVGRDANHTDDPYGWRTSVPTNKPSTMGLERSGEADTATPPPPCLPQARSKKGRALSPLLRIESATDVLVAGVHQVVICSYAVAKSKGMNAKLRAFGFQTCIPDESHALRSPAKSAVPSGGSLVTEQLVPLVTSCRYRILLTATPAGKTGAHYQPQLQCVRPDVQAFCHYRTFANRYGRPMLRMTASNRDTVVYCGHTYEAELYQLLITHLMYRLKDSTRLATEDRLASLEWKRAKCTTVPVPSSTVSPAPIETTNADPHYLTVRYTSVGLVETWAPLPTAVVPPVGSVLATGNGNENTIRDSDRDVLSHKFLFAGGTRVAASAGATAPPPQGRVQRHRTVHWITPDHESATKLAKLAEEERALQATLDATHNLWAAARERVAEDNKHGQGEEGQDGGEGEGEGKGEGEGEGEREGQRKGATPPLVDVVYGSVDTAALATQQQRNELLRRTSLMKVKAARIHLTHLLLQQLDAGKKVVVMAYHKAMMNVAETVIREVLNVHHTVNRLGNGTAAVPRGRVVPVGTRLRPPGEPPCPVPVALPVPSQTRVVGAQHDTPDTPRGSSTEDIGTWNPRVRKHARTGTPKNHSSGAKRAKTIPIKETAPLRGLALRATLPYIRLDGSVSSHKTVAASIHRFQTDPACRVALLSIPKACLGITLTAGTCMLFLELTHKPQDLLQAEARIDRRGQLSPSVDIVYMLLRNSVEAQVWERNRAKLNGAARMSDGQDAGFGYRTLLV